jgi:hypothetical protein
MVFIFSDMSPLEPGNLNSWETVDFRCRGHRLCHFRSGPLRHLRVIRLGLNFLKLAHQSLGARTACFSSSQKIQCSLIPQDAPWQLLESPFSRHSQSCMLTFMIINSQRGIRVIRAILRFSKFVDDLFSFDEQGNRLKARKKQSF